MAADLKEQWRLHMQQGVEAQRRLHFEEARQALESAEQDAHDLDDEHRDLTYSALDDLFEETGDYTRAEEVLRKAIALKDSCTSKFALMNMLLKAGRSAEATALREQSKVNQDNDHAARCMSYIQADMKKRWLPLLPSRLDRTKFFTINASNRTDVMFRLNPKHAHPVAFYVSESCGGEELDNAVLSAVSQLNIKPIQNKLDYPVHINFSFDYNSFMQPFHVPIDRKRLRNETTYKRNRELLKWQEEKLGVDHPEVAQTLGAAADWLHESPSSAERDAAPKVIQHAIKIWEKNKIECIATAAAYKLHGQVLFEQKRFKESLAALDKSNDIYKKVCTANDYRLLDAKRALRKTLSKLGEAERTKQLTSEIKAIELARK